MSEDLLALYSLANGHGLILETLVRHLDKRGLLSKEELAVELSELAQKIEVDWKDAYAPDAKRMDFAALRNLSQDLRDGQRQSAKFGYRDKIDVDTPANDGAVNGNKSEIVFRRAYAQDLPAIVALLADDTLGAGREDPSTPLAPSYLDAFSAIAADPNQLLVVAVDGPEVIGTLQLTFIPGLSRKGALRGQIEAVRVARHRRSGGIGGKMFEWAIEKCRSRGCSHVQLTTDKGRADAHRFYESLGFTGSHLGYKKTL